MASTVAANSSSSHPVVVNQGLIYSRLTKNTLIVNQGDELGGLNFPKEGRAPINVVELDGDVHALSGFATLIDLMRDAGVGKMQLAAYYLSAMKIIMPGIRPYAESFLQAGGYEPTTVKIPSQLYMLALTAMSPPLDMYAMYLQFSQMFLMLFKNISNENYEVYMQNRCQALKGLIFGEREEKVEVLMRIESAKLIRGFVGNSREIRRFAVRWMMQTTTCKDFRAKIAGYLLNVIEYTEMSAIPFIAETLVLTNSPVLKSVTVAAEVVNYKKAVDLITASDHPKFFRIMSLESTHELDRSNFSLLLEIAVAIKMDAQPSLKFFARPKSGDRSKIITNHVAIHNTMFNPKPTKAVRESWAFLTDGDDEGEMFSIG